MDNFELKHRDSEESQSSDGEPFSNGNRAGFLSPGQHSNVSVGSNGSCSSKIR